jgi:hypothetical protein
MNKSFYFVVIALSFIYFFKSNNKLMIEGIHSMTVDELSAWLSYKPANATMVDVREYTELVEQGVIKGYDVNIPWFLTNTNPELFEKKFGSIDKEAQVKRKKK